MEKKKIKIVTIGGGSSYTPELMEGFIKRYEECPISEIWLVDVEEGREKLEIVGAMAQRMWDASGYDVKVHLTLNRREALPNADFVTTQFRVGLLNARIKDERIPSSYGLLGQETNGAGGIFKAFRTIPVILDIVEDMKELCPNAWLINFTNPSGIVTEAVIKRGGFKRCIGLCNVPVGAMLYEPEMIGKTTEDLNFQFAGLNHFHWHRISDNLGNDVTKEVISHLNDQGNEATPKNIMGGNLDLDFLTYGGLVPCAYHRYYMMQDDMVKHGVEEYEKGETRAQKVKITEDELFELYKDPNLNYKPKQLAMRGGANYSDAACECVNCIVNNKNSHMVVSTQNNGAIADLPYDCVVEISALIGADGAKPLNWGHFNSFERGWVQVMKAMEECAIEAAVSGNYEAALQAFIINPQIPGGKVAKDLLNEMLVAHKKYLPQFKDAIAKLEEQGVVVRDETCRELCEKGL